MPPGGAFLRSSERWRALISEGALTSSIHLRKTFCSICAMLFVMYTVLGMKVFKVRWEKDHQPKTSRGMASKRLRTIALD